MPKPLLYLNWNANFGPPVSTPLWTPADITTAAWYDASDASTITESGGAVSQWDDKSGNLKHLTQGVGAQQPQTGGSIGGVDAIEFDGTDDWMVAPSLGLTSDAMFIAVFDPDAETNYSIAGTTGGNTHIDLLTASTYQRVFRTTRLGAAVLGMPTNAPTILAYNADSGAPKFNTHINGADTQLDTSAFTFEDNITDICSRGGGTSSWLNGPLGEIVILDRFASDAERQKLEGYLAWKWDGGVAGTLVGLLPALHPYKSAPPTA